MKFALRQLAKSPGVAFVAIATCLLLAWKATRIDPNEALRAE